MNKFLKVVFVIAIGFITANLFSIDKLIASTILTTNSTDTVGTFRTNVNTSLTNLNTDKIQVSGAATGSMIYYTAGTWTALASGTNNRVLLMSGGVPAWATSSLGTGDVTGPASSIDNEIIRFDGTGGKTIQGSSAFLISDAGIVSSGTWQGSVITATYGGSGVSSLTDGGILIGGGTGVFTALGVATNGQLPIGDGTTAPTLATLTGTANEIDITNGAGSITIGLVDPLAVSKGGTSKGSTPSNGQLPIGNGTDFTFATLTQGSNVTITNASGSITIASTGGGGSGSGFGYCEALTPGRAVLPNSNAPGFAKVVESNTAYQSLDFDASTDETAYWSFKVRDVMGFNTSTALFSWTASSTATGTVTFDLSVSSRASSSLINQTYEVNTSSTFTYSSTTRGVLQTYSVAITPTSTFSVSDQAFVKLFRDVSEDALAVDARLIDLEICFD